MSYAGIACDVYVCREVWDDVGNITSTAAEPSAASVHHQPLQCPVAVTSIPNIPGHSSQSKLSGTPLKRSAVRQPSNTDFTSLPSSLPSSVNNTAGLLVQFRQLVESCGLPDQTASGLMNWFAQELHSVTHTLGLPLQQESRHTDSLPVNMSTAGYGAATVLPEVRTSEMCCAQSNGGDILAASVESGSMPATRCSQEAADLHPSATLALAERAASQYSTGVMQPSSVAASVDQLSSLAHLQQLQQMYLESAASALRSLCILQQQLATAVSTTVDNTGSTGSMSAATPALDAAVRSQSCDNIPHCE